MLRFCCGCVIFRWKSTSSVIIHYNLTEPSWCLCLIFSSSWGDFRGDTCCVSNMTADQLEKKSQEELTWRDEWENHQSCQKKCVFSLRWCTSVENSFKVKKNVCGTAEPRGFLPLHTGLGQVTQLVVVSVELWMHYHPSPVNCSRHQSTSASLERSYCLNLQNKSSEKRSSRGLRSWLKCETCSGVCQSLWKCASSIVSRLLHRSLPTHTDTMSPCVHKCHIYSTKSGKENKQKP